MGLCSIISLKKLCTSCKKVMLSWGSDRKGKPRYRCKSCNVTSQRRRPDTILRNQKKAQDNWLGTTTSLTTVGKRCGVTRRTLTRRFSKITEVLRSVFCVEYSVTLIVDATWITNGVDLLFLVIQGKHHVPVAQYLGSRETEYQWIQCLKLVPYTPQCVICDGHKGLQKAVRAVFGATTRIQRCLVHITRFVKTRTTQRPRTQAGKDLLYLIGFLCRIRTTDQAHRWLIVFDEWKRIHYEFLEEKTIHGNSKPTFVHRNLRRARYHIEHARENLFVYLELDCEHTTNALEGGYNARLAELLHNHRGSKIENMKKLIARYLNIRTQV